MDLSAGATITLPDSIGENIAFDVFLETAQTITYTVSGAATLKSDGTQQSIQHSAVTCRLNVLTNTWRLVGRLS